MNIIIAYANGNRKFILKIEWIFRNQLFCSYNQGGHFFLQMYLNRQVDSLRISDLHRIKTIQSKQGSRFYVHLVHLKTRFKCFSNPIMTLSFWTDRSQWANSEDPDQTPPIGSYRSSLIRVFTVRYSICIILIKYLKLWPLSLNFR